MLTALFAATLAAACDRAPGGAREWAPSDHDPPGAGEAQGQPQGQPKKARGSDVAGLVELAWTKNCVPCHGPRGRGDGPQGPMLRAPDLTRAEWQARVTDEEIQETIRKGRNKMPGFDLPPPVLKGLAELIRSNRAKP